jgi:hypothetical protein
MQDTCEEPVSGRVHMAGGLKISSWIGQDFITTLFLDCRHAPSTYSFAQQGHSYSPLLLDLT